MFISVCARQKQCDLQFAWMQRGSNKTISHMPDPREPPDHLAIVASRQGQTEFDAVNLNLQSCVSGKGLQQ